MFKPGCLSVFIVMLAMLGCSSSTDETPDNVVPAVSVTASQTNTTAPTTQTHKPQSDQKPGDLVSQSPLDLPGIDAIGVRYLSTSVDGELVEVTGMILTPPQGVGDNPEIISWAHGTTGVADVCAPSLNVDQVSAAPIALAQGGYVVAVTDYEGLGTDGTHPYLVGRSEGRSVIDIVRAAQQLDLGVGSRYAVAGLSQGGHGALWAGQIADSYAPELDLVGVVAAAPATNFEKLMETIGTPVQGFAMMSAVALDAVYDDVLLEDYFTPQAIEVADVVHQGCTLAVFGAFASMGRDKMILPGAWNESQPMGPLGDRLAENEVAQADVSAPVLLIQGSADAVVSSRDVEDVHARYCSMDTDAEYRLYEGGSHGNTIMTAMGDVLVWIGDRFGDAAVVDGCVGVN